MVEIVLENGQRLLVPTDLNLNFVNEGETLTNLQRIKQGLAAIDPSSKKAYELHHIGQTVDSPLAILPWNYHRGEGYKSILHDPNIKEGVHSLLSNSDWNKQVKTTWKLLAQALS